MLRQIINNQPSSKKIVVIRIAVILWAISSTLVFAPYTGANTLSNAELPQQKSLTVDSLGLPISSRSDQLPDSSFGSHHWSLPFIGSLKPESAISAGLEANAYHDTKHDALSASALTPYPVSSAYHVLKLETSLEPSTNFNAVSTEAIESQKN